MSDTKSRSTTETGGASPKQIEVEALFAAQERENRRRTGWIAVALVGVVAAGAVTGGAVTGAFGNDDETEAAGGNQDTGSSATAAQSPNAEPAGADVAATASPEADAAADAEAAAAETAEAEAASEAEAAAAPEAAPAPEASAASSYTVSSGDTLWSITQTTLAGGPSTQVIEDSVQSVYQANQDLIGNDPSILRVGQELTIPSAASVSTSTDTGEAAAPSPSPAESSASGGGSSSAAGSEAGAGSHVVAPGESLWAITDAALGGNATADQVLDAWPAIYEANREIIGDDPDVITPGLRLSIPALV